MYRILICDDEEDIVGALRIYLTDAGYQVCSASNGREALELLHGEGDGTDLVLLDIMMPGLDGIETMRRIREYSNVPIILLTAKGEEMDQIAGLGEGADDYITKPFRPAELLARVRSQLRRYHRLGGAPSTAETFCIGGIELDDKAKQVTLDGEPAPLTPLEYDILKLLMEHPGEVFSPKQIYERVWQDPSLGSESTVAVHIRHLREKLEYDPAHPRHIVAVWGRGYRMEV